MTNIGNNVGRLSSLFVKVARNVIANPSKTFTDIERYVNRVHEHAPPFLFEGAKYGLPNVVPLNFAIEESLANTPTLNTLIPVMTMNSMSGGPNTAINIAYRMAALGVPVRFISTDLPMDSDQAPLWNHFSSLTGITERLRNVQICCGDDRTKPLYIGENDVFFATAWWTAQMVKPALPLTKPAKFLYLLAEYEPAFHPWGTEYALALETYSLNFRAFICGSLLRDYFNENGIGRFSDPSFIDQCVCFEPAVDMRMFYPRERTLTDRPRRLLFYARPTTARRNLSELGLHALRNAVAEGLFAGENWEMLFIGEPSLPSIQLGNGIVAHSAPWLDYDSYAELLRNSDILLSLMLSPHTSYPPIEIAATGGIAITNTFATKTVERLKAISTNIIAVSATAEGVLDGLREAVLLVRDAGRPATGTINLPRDWNDSFEQLLPKSLEMFQDCLNSRA